MKKDKEAEKKEKRKICSSICSGNCENCQPRKLKTQILETLLQHIGGKWKIRIIWALQNAQSKRYSTLKNEVSSITDMMLSQSLKELMASGIVERHQYQEIPPRVEYQITQKGLALIPIFQDCISWVESFESKNETK